MRDDSIEKISFLKKIFNYISNKIKIIAIIFVIFFIIFISFQIYSFYSINKIKKNSITFFNTQNLENLTLIQENISQLSNENDFYGILSKLELIKLKFKDNDYQMIIDLYEEILKTNDLDKIYKSAIASIASYQIINIAFTDLSNNYSEIINNFINTIDNNLINYKGIKLELSYLATILNGENNNIKYLNNNEAIELYNNIMNSEITSSIIKERINKIHEFFSYN